MINVKQILEALEEKVRIKKEENCFDKKWLKEEILKINHVNYMGFGAYRITYSLGEKLVIKCARNEYGVRCNIFEHTLYKLANSKQKKYLAPCLWISKNGRFAIYLKIKKDNALFLHDIDFESISSMFPKGIQQDWWYETNAFVTTKNRKNRIILVDYSDNEYLHNTPIEDVVKFTKECLNGLAYRKIENEF